MNCYVTMFHANICYFVCLHAILTYELNLFCLAGLLQAGKNRLLYVSILSVCFESQLCCVPVECMSCIVLVA